MKVPVTIKAISFALLAAGTAAFCAGNSQPSTGAEPGLSMYLPPEVSEWRGEIVEASEAEKRILPADTEISKRLYERRNETGLDQVFCTIVLSGKDRTSIHRPEICLTGQGWRIVDADTVAFDLSNGENLKARRLTLQRDLPAAEEVKEERIATAYYVYWFVGSRATTPDHFDRILSTVGSNLLSNDNPRWAYVGVLTLVTDSLVEGGNGPEETMEILSGFLGDAVPRFQTVFEPVGWF